MNYAPSKLRIFFLFRVSGLPYLFLCCELCQEFNHIFQSIALLQTVKHTVDLVCVIQGPWAQCKLCHLSRSEHWQGFGLRKGINTKSGSRNCKNHRKDISVWEKGILQPQVPLTLEKLAFRACRSCRVAKPEKPPRFARSQSSLSLSNETQPGSAKKPETKTLAGYNHCMPSGHHQIELGHLPLPDESFLERNGLMKWV